MRLSAPGGCTQFEKEEEVKEDKNVDAKNVKPRGSSHAPPVDDLLGVQWLRPRSWLLFREGSQSGRTSENQSTWWYLRE